MRVRGLYEKLRLPNYSSNIRLREASAKKSVLPLQTTVKELHGRTGALFMRHVLPENPLENRSGGTRSRTGDTMTFRPVPLSTAERHWLSLGAPKLKSDRSRRGKTPEKTRRDLYRLLSFHLFLKLLSDLRW